MPTNLAGVLFALASFAVTFAVARLLANWLRKRRLEKDELLREQGESRQVRRARQRGKAGG